MADNADEGRLARLPDEVADRVRARDSEAREILDGKT